MDDPALLEMQEWIERWQEVHDQRAIFLSCYRMMTMNMLEAIRRDEFSDGGWVDHLLHRFADYYFLALHAYEERQENVPVVWQAAFRAAAGRDYSPLQNLLLGVNAHINYDLVLTLEELLQPEWAELSPARRAVRRTDHNRVNRIIAATIDAVQDQILEPAMPVLQAVDVLMGRVDEGLISGMITRWRGRVWQHAVYLVETSSEFERKEWIERVEREALRTALWIGWKG
ncbi:hypothetical protein BECAL_00077 [Bellilinea caldifistulae]|nr:DUF5995 family protein [Bellilinea caldifistulae]GAP08945.1 hypothetical protein BECAL_00077 [Bellilinea caldifistulae]